MANIFIRRGRAVPAQTHALRRTRKTDERYQVVNACITARHRPRRDRVSVHGGHRPVRCPLTGKDRKLLADRQNDANDRAPRGRELSVREDLTRIIVDWSGSWQAARPGNWLGRSPATKAALGR